MHTKLSRYKGRCPRPTQSSTLRVFQFHVDPELGLAMTIPINNPGEMCDPIIIPNMHKNEAPGALSQYYKNRWEPYGKGL